MDKRVVGFVAVVCLCVALLGSGLVFVNQYGHVSHFPQSGKTDHFTLYEADWGQYEGINGSAHHLSANVVNYPVLNVSLGDTVVIVVHNVNSDEAHSLGIDHYYDKSVLISPNSIVEITFVANKAGEFRVYCNIACVMMPFMTQGLLIVH